MKPRLIIRRTQHSGVLSDDIWMVHGRCQGDNDVSATIPTRIDQTGTAS